MKFQIPVLVVIAGVLVLPPSAHATEMTDYFALAIRNGKANGALSGQIAEMISAQTKSSQPVAIEVRAIGSFASPECKRLRVYLAQAGVPTTTGRLATIFVPPFELNFCLDGRPPVETLTADTQRQQGAAVEKLRQELIDSGRVRGK